MTLSIKQPQRQTKTQQTASRLLSIGASKNRVSGRGYEMSKRAFDILVIGFAIPLLLPLVAVISLLVKLDSPNAPVFDKQKYVGKYGMRFSLYKFNTTGEFGVTRLGNVLRMTGLDQLPQMINVLLGNMTLVGPRPTQRGVEFYADRQLARLDVTPGLTGLWQVAGNSSMNFDQSSDLDVAYVDNRGPLLDIVLLLYTVVAALK